MMFGGPGKILICLNVELLAQGSRMSQMTNTLFHPDELALLATIHASPKDDAPRLLYADWLKKHEQPEYAEFIRLQCQKPYVAITTRGVIRGSFRNEFPEEDSAAEDRLHRICEIYPRLLSTDRFAPFRQEYFLQEFRRGLANWEVDHLHQSWVTDPSPLLRFRFSIEGPAEEFLSVLEGARDILLRADELYLNLMYGPEELELDPEPFVDLGSVDFSFLQGLEEVAFWNVPNRIAEQIAVKARAAGVIVSYD